MGAWGQGTLSPLQRPLVLEALFLPKASGPFFSSHNVPAASEGGDPWINAPRCSPTVGPMEAHPQENPSCSPEQASGGHTLGELPTSKLFFSSCFGAAQCEVLRQG